MGRVTSDDAAWSLTYLANWQRAAGGELGDLGHTWSLAVEEQYYLLFPIVFVVLVRRRNLLVGALVAAVVAGAAWRTWSWTGAEDTDRVYFGTDTRVDAILLGALLAVAITGGWGRRVPPWAMAAVTVALAGLVAIDHDPFVYRAGITAAAVLSAALLLAVVGPNPLRVRFLELPALVLVGELSYALYLWHVPVQRILVERVDDAVTRAVLMFVLSAALAWLSVRLVERPAMNLRRRLDASAPARPVEDVRATGGRSAASRADA
jgi:peptidoglycan/LPS O-acetylase OafA/YrhL